MRRYAYAITCEKLDGTDVKVSGNCFHEFENAVEFVKNRGDNPIVTRNPMIWESNTNVYKIIPLTFED